jgi:hypothetical protein
MPSIKKLLQAAAGNAGGGNLYVEDVFSTYLYEGNSSTQTITNGANFTASATKEIIDTSYTYFAFDAWSQSGNGTSVPAFTATDSVSDGSAGAFASISFEGDGSDALSSSNGEGGLVWTKTVLILTLLITFCMITETWQLLTI